jgi:hypothetical protein
MLRGSLLAETVLGKRLENFGLGIMVKKNYGIRH